MKNIAECAHSLVGLPTNVGGHYLGAMYFNLVRLLTSTLQGYPFLFKASDEERDEPDELEPLTTQSHEIQGQVGYDSNRMDATQSLSSSATQVSANFYFSMRITAQLG